MASRNGSTLEVAISIAGKVDKSLKQSIGTAQREASSFSRTVGAIGTAGLAAMGALTTATVTGLAKCTEEAAKFENYMSDVVKVVDGLADATGKASDLLADNGKTYAQNYAAMEESLKDLSTQIPYTFEDLTRLAAAAGQSGKTFEDLTGTDFLKDIAMWGTAMDISADQAGDWGAKWEQAFNMNHEQVMELADVINYLGNSYATTAAEIAQSVNDSASMGQLAGVDPAATAAIAASMQAMGVSSDKVGTSIKRIYTNVTKGSTATKAQQEAFEKLGFTATGIAQAMQTDGTGTLLKVFEAVNDLPDAEKLSTLNTLFGQWAIEGGAKITQNLTLLTGMLDELSDESVWKGSTEKEFIIKATTPEAIETMLGSTKQALMDDIGDAFLPVYKDFGLFMIEYLRGVRENLPELTQLAESLGKLAKDGVTRLGDAMVKALPHIQDGLDYLLNNGEQVASTLKKLAIAFTVMKFAPAAEKLLKGAGSLLFGTGGNSTASGLGTLIGNGGLLGKGGIWDAARTGAAMANSSMTTGAGELLENGKAATLGQKLYNNVVGGLVGIFNRNKLFGGETPKRAWGNIVGVSGKIASAKTFLPGIAKALGSGAVTMTGGAAVGAGSLLGGIAGAAGIGSGIKDIIQGAKTTGKEAKDSYFSGGTKIGMVGTGAAAGAAIGSLFGGVGAAPGALIGAGIGGIGALLGGSKLGKALSDATDEGGWIANIPSVVEAFFTQTIPTWWSGITEQTSTFFTQTLPEKWKAFWDGVGSFLTETVPYAIGYAAGKTQIFFTQTVPEKWDAMWAAIGNFFTVTVPTWANDAWSNHIVPFFTVTIPEKWDAMWTAIGNFFTVTIPTWASGTWNDHIVPFFTESLPQFFEDLWNSVKGFFSETLPSLASTIWSSIKSFFTETIPGFFSGLWSKITGNASAGYAAATGSVQPHAAGGIFTSPHLGLVAEAGAESIIPLSAGRRSQGIDLWTRTGQLLGVNPVELADIPEGEGFGGGGVTFAPQITIQGNADRSVIDEALNEARAQFEAWYLQMQRRQARTAY